MWKKITGILWFGLSLSLHAKTNPAADLGELDLEQLMRVRITSVSKHPESRFEAGAAIYVISNEELRRNGFATIADSLRTVPGMDVGQVNAHTWAVSARGFNGEYANKLLVLNDGRSVYNPLSSGVYWDALDPILADVNRIEVIRGPGATLWGANAVNGVINIISKSAKETQGLLVSAGGGSTERGFGEVRYGEKLGDHAWMRVFAKYSDPDSLALANSTGAADDWWMAHTGFRADWEANAQNLLTLQGEYYQGNNCLSLTQPIANAPFENTTTLASDVIGANVLGRWTYSQSEESEFKVQTYFDHTERESNLPSERRDTFDLEGQHAFTWLHRNHIVWGLGYRVSTDQIRGDFAQMFAPDHRTLNLFNSFLQDEIALVENQLHLTLGGKLEHNDFTGFEVQPSGRLVWTPTPKQTVWASVSRAVRTPSRAEDDVRVNLATQPASSSVFSILGDRRGVSENLMAYELGYRLLPHPRVSVDVTAFYNDYDNLRSLQPGPPASSPTALATFYSANQIVGETYGVELSTSWQPLDRWHLQSAYTFFQAHLHRVDGSLDAATEQFYEGSSPAHQFSLRSQVDVTRHVEFDCGLRFVDALHNPNIPAYVTADVRLGWRPNNHWEISISGLNLFDNQHPEFAPQVINTPLREVRRSVFGKITWRF
jgi:iron complex outermembrane receptor protein